MNKIKVLTDQDKIVYKGKFLSMVERKYKINGEIGTYEMCVRNEVDKIIACLPVSKDNNFILTKEFRIPINAYTIGVPAGLGDKKGENPLDIVKREVLEETGYKTGRIIPQFITPTSEGLTNEILDCFIATDCEKASEGQSLEGPEDIEVIEVPVKKVDEFIYKQVVNGISVGSRTLALIEMYKKMKK